MIHMNGDSSVGSVIKMIEQKTKEIWSEPPSEIASLLEPKGPYGSSFPIVINAYSTANGLASTLWALRKCARTGDSIDCLADVSKNIIDSHIVIFEVCGLTATTKLLKNVSAILSHVKDPKRYVLLLEKLIVYLNRLGMAGWIDLLIPWRRLSYAFDEEVKEDL